jgi:hypothetical protein
VVKGHVSNPWHRLRPLSAAPLAVRRRYLIEVPSLLPAAPLVVRSKILWPLRRCAFRVLSRGVPRPTPARPWLVHASTVSGMRQDLATIADKSKALGKLFARLTGSCDASCLPGRKGRAYVMRVHHRARVTYAAATPAMSLPSQYLPPSPMPC